MTNFYVQHNRAYIDLREIKVLEDCSVDAIEMIVYLSRKQFRIRIPKKDTEELVLKYAVPAIEEELREDLKSLGFETEQPVRRVKTNGDKQES